MIIKIHCSFVSPSDHREAIVVPAPLVSNREERRTRRRSFFLSGHPVAWIMISGRLCRTPPHRHSTDWLA
jgi:hypothetical protein